MSDANRQIRRALASWAANGWLAGMDEDKQRELARIAAEAIDQPQTWGVGEVVPSGVDQVLDDRQLRWVRDVGPHGGGVWICYASEDELTALVGPVTEDTDDPRSEPGPDGNPSVCRGCGAAPGDPHAVACTHRDWTWGASSRRCPAHGDRACTWCTQTIPGGLEDGQCRGCDMYAETGMHWDTCQYRVRRAPPARTTACQARHPDRDDAACDIIHHPLSPHPLWHADGTLRIGWWEQGPPADTQGSELAAGTVAPGHASADGEEAADKPTEPQVALTKAAVDGLVGLLHQSAVRFTRLHTAYKGSATKGANTLAAECEQAAQLLQAVLNGEEEDKDA